MQEYINADAYMHFSTPPRSSKLACTFMVCTSIQYATTPHEQHYLKYQHFRVLYKAPGLLIIKLKAPLLEETIYVAHAPHAQPYNTPAQIWWDTFHGLAEKWPDHDIR